MVFSGDAGGDTNGVPLVGLPVMKAMTASTANDEFREARVKIGARDFCVLGLFC